MQTDLRHRVEEVIREHVAPALELDGTAIEVVAVTDGIASVRFGASCASCPGGIAVLLPWMEQELRKHLPEVEFIEAVP